MTFKPLILAALVLITGTAAFAQTNPLYNYIQPGSRMVMSFNPLKIAAKVPGETFRQSSLYKDMLKKDNGDISSLLTNPSGSGIDFATNFILSTGSSGEDNKATVLYGRLADQSKFAALMRKMNKGDEDNIQVFGNNRLILPKSFGPAIAWNDEVFVITGMGNGKKELNAVFADTTDTRDMEVRMNEVTERLQKGLRELCFATLTPKTTGPGFTSPVFNSLMLESGDIKIWNSGEPPTNPKGIKQLPPFMTQFLSRMQAATGSESTSIINFEKGKIAGTIRNFIHPEMGAIYQKYPQEELPTGLVSRLPEGKILMLIMTAANKEMTKELNQKNGMTELLDSLKNFLKMDVSLLQKAFKSKGLFSIMELPSKEEDAEGEKKNILKNMGVFFVMPVADKMAVAKLKEMADRKLDSLANTEKGEKIMSMFRPVIRFNDSLCVISMSAEMADAYLNNPGTAALPAWLPARQNGSMWMNLNFREIMQMVFSKAGKPGKNKDKQAMEIFSNFDQIIMTGGEYANGSLNSQMEFRFSNQEKNVLEQIFDIVNRISQEKAQARSESFTTPVIVQDEEVTEAPKDAPVTKEPAPAKKPVTKTKAAVKSKG